MLYPLDCSSFVHGRRWKSTESKQYAASLDFLRAKSGVPGGGEGIPHCDLCRAKYGRTSNAQASSALPIVPMNAPHRGDFAGEFLFHLYGFPALPDGLNIGHIPTAILLLRFVA